jgi:uncharacterized protein
MSIAPDLLEILRCPFCVQEKEGRLTMIHDEWLVCQEAGCGRKYPISGGIPVMLIEEGDKWKNTRVEDLPIPPPQTV